MENSFESTQKFLFSAEEFFDWEIFKLVIGDFFFFLILPMTHRLRVAEQNR